MVACHIPLLFLASAGCEESGESTEAVVVEVSDTEEQRVGGTFFPVEVDVEWLELVLPTGAPRPCTGGARDWRERGLAIPSGWREIQRETLTFIDIDEVDSDAFPFRTTLLDEEGNTLWSRSIREPIQVREFLAGAGLSEMGIDPIGIVPKLATSFSRFRRWRNPVSCVSSTPNWMIHRRCWGSRFGGCARNAQPSFS